MSIDHGRIIGVLNTLATANGWTDEDFATLMNGTGEHQPMGVMACRRKPSSLVKPRPNRLAKRKAKSGRKDRRRAT